MTDEPILVQRTTDEKIDLLILHVSVLEQVVTILDRAQTETLMLVRELVAHSDPDD